jgi:hypothetical protein
MGESSTHKKILTTRRLSEFFLPKFTAVQDCDDDDDKGSVRGWQKLVFALPHPQMFIFLSRSQNVTNFPLFSLFSPKTVTISISHLSHEKEEDDDEEKNYNSMRYIYFCSLFLSPRATHLKKMPKPYRVTPPHR